MQREDVSLVPNPIIRLTNSANSIVQQGQRKHVSSIKPSGPASAGNGSLRNSNSGLGRAISINIEPNGESHQAINQHPRSARHSATRNDRRITPITASPADRGVTPTDTLNSSNVDQGHSAAGKLSLSQTILREALTFLLFILCLISGMSLTSAGLFVDQLPQDPEDDTAELPDVELPVSRFQLNFSILLGILILLYSIAGMCLNCMRRLPGKYTLCWIISTALGLLGFVIVTASANYGTDY